MKVRKKRGTGRSNADAVQKRRGKKPVFLPAAGSRFLPRRGGRGRHQHSLYSVVRIVLLERDKNAPGIRNERLFGVLRETSDRREELRGGGLGKGLRGVTPNHRALSSWLLFNIGRIKGREGKFRGQNIGV